jgi:predicted MPP superfamily phosphohydrolase
LHCFDSIDGIGARGLTETGNFQIMVGHYPNFAIKDYMNAEQAPDLMLAGHTHGGQVYVPGFGPLRIKYTGRDAITPASMYRGFFTFENGSHLLVTRGTGMERGWAPRIRFLCKPEISVIDITPGFGIRN